MNLFHRAALLAAAGALAPAAWACSSCGCTLNSDWASQGFHAGDGLSVDLRFDRYDQHDLRRGTHRVDRASVAFPADEEVQQRTLNRSLTLTIDDKLSEDWGVSVALPWHDRFHSTLAEGDTSPSSSSSSSLGDVRVLARYEGFDTSHMSGLQFGLKLPTGGIGIVFRDGPQAGEPLDRGLQPGTGTTDLLLGGYRFGTLGEKLDWFAQAMLQLPLNSRRDFKPGAGLNASAGLRWMSEGPVAPHLQLNLRSERRESGAQADVENSGSTLMYLSPGATWTITPTLQAYGFVQVPVWQRVNGTQIEPRTSVSVGLRASF